jgi:lysophospholipase L1-like esterase
MKHNISTKSLLLICLVIYGGSSSAETLPTVIALFGDSTTVGYVPPSAGDSGFTDREGAGTTTRGTPTTHLSEILNEGVLKRPAVVANWGFGSSTTGAAPDPDPDPEEEPAPPPPNLPGNGLSRIDNDLASTKSTHAGSEYLVLIIYGTNDFVSSIDPGTTRFNILQMIIKARNQGFEPIIGTTLPRSDRSPAQIANLNAFIASAASNGGAFLVDQHAVFGASPSTYQPLMVQELATVSGNPIYLHPSVEGYRQMAQKWLDARLADIITPKSIIIAGAISLLLLSDEIEPAE